MSKILTWWLLDAFSLKSCSCHFALNCHVFLASLDRGMKGAVLYILKAPPRSRWSGNGNFFLTITSTNIFSVDIQYIHISRWTWAAPAFWSCLFLYFFWGLWLLSHWETFDHPDEESIKAWLCLGGYLQQLFLRYFSLLPCNLPCNYDLYVAGWKSLFFNRKHRKYIMHSGSIGN